MLLLMMRSAINKKRERERMKDEKMYKKAHPEDPVYLHFTLVS